MQFAALIIFLGAAVQAEGYLLESDHRFHNGHIVKRAADEHHHHHGHHDGGDNDLHGKFCVDISEYGEVQYHDPEEKTCCETVLQKVCTNKTDNVCDMVTDMVCDVHPYTECFLHMKNITRPTSYTTVDTFVPNTCETGDKIQKHKKFEPVCEEKESLNCVQVWKELANGQKVREVTDECKTVKWKDCKLVPTEVDFVVPTVNCYPGNKTIEYQTCKREDKEFMATELKCNVKWTAKCQPRKRLSCMEITYRECEDRAIEKCDDRAIQVREPYQKFDHKEWCLFPDKHEGSEVATSDDSEAEVVDSQGEDSEAEAVDSQGIETLDVGIGTNQVLPGGVRVGRSGFMPLFESLRQADGSWR